MSDPLAATDIARIATARNGGKYLDDLRAAMYDSAKTVISPGSLREEGTFVAMYHSAETVMEHQHGSRPRMGKKFRMVLIDRQAGTRTECRGVYAGAKTIMITLIQLTYIPCDTGEQLLQETRARLESGQGPGNQVAHHLEVCKRCSAPPFVERNVLFGARDSRDAAAMVKRYIQNESNGHG